MLGGVAEDVSSNISVALDPHGMLKCLKFTINGGIIINSANMYLVNLLPKRFRLSAYQRSTINKKFKKN